MDADDKTDVAQTAADEEDDDEAILYVKDLEGVDFSNSEGLCFFV